MPDKFSFRGKHSVVVGGSTGMGQAAAQLLTSLGSTVAVVDIETPRDHVEFIKVDLRDKGSINDAVSHISDGPKVDALFSCAGIDQSDHVVTVNFIGQRHLIEAAVSMGLLPPGSAVAIIASIAGIGWEAKLPILRMLLEITDFDEAAQWITEHPEHRNYTFSKQMIQAYVGWRAAEFGRIGIRINASGPGPTLTPLMAQHDAWRAFERTFQSLMGRPGATALEQAYPLVFLNSDAASFVSGTTLIVDAGYTGSGKTGAIEASLVQQLAPPVLQAP